MSSREEASLRSGHVPLLYTPLPRRAPTAHSQKNPPLSGGGTGSGRATGNKGQCTTNGRSEHLRLFRKSVGATGSGCATSLNCLFLRLTRKSASGTGSGRATGSARRSGSATGNEGQCTTNGLCFFGGSDATGLNFFGDVCSGGVTKISHLKGRGQCVRRSREKKAPGAGRGKLRSGAWKRC